MATVTFTGNIQRHVTCPSAVLDGATVGALMAAYFSLHPLARSYVLDDQGAVRKHMVIILDGNPINDRTHLSDPLLVESEVFVFQALSGG